MEMEDFYKGELSDAYLYSELSKKERNPSLRKRLVELSEIESGHAKFWYGMLLKYNKVPDSRIRKLKIKYLIFLRRIFGIAFIINYLEGGEVRAIQDYSKYLENTKDDEIRTKLNDIINDEKDHEQTFIKMNEEFSSNAEKTKDSIYGMSDGLIEILAGVAGLTGVLSKNFYVFIGGLIFALSGMISMTIGAYVSTRASNQIKGQGKGYSSLSAAGNTALFYFIGAVFPLIPFLFLSKYIALIVAVSLALIVDFIASSVISISSGGDLKKDISYSLTLIFIGFVATFLIGMLVHHFIGNVI